MFACRTALLTAFAFVAATSAVAQDDDLYKKWNDRFVEIDGKFHTVPFFVPKVADNVYLNRGPVKSHGPNFPLRVLKVRKGDADLIVSAQKDQLDATRLVGYPSKGIVDGQELQPPGGSIQIVVVGTCDVPVIVQGKDTTQKVFLAVPLDVVQRGLTKEQFGRLLKEKPNFSGLEVERQKEAADCAEDLLRQSKSLAAQAQRAPGKEAKEWNAAARLGLTVLATDFKDRPEAKEAAALLKKLPK